MQAVIHLRGDEVYPARCDHLTVAAQDLDRQAHADLSGAFRRNIYIDFEIGVLIDRGQQRCGLHIIADMHGNVADDAGEGCADLIVG